MRDGLFSPIVQPPLTSDWMLPVCLAGRFYPNATWRLYVPSNVVRDVLF